MLLHYGYCIAYGTQCQSCQSVSRDPTGIWCTQHMAFWALRERPMHCRMTDQCRPSGLDQRALRCVLVREREIHRKIRSNLTVLNLTSALKPVDTIPRTAQEKKERKNAPAVAVKMSYALVNKRLPLIFTAGSGERVVLLLFKEFQVHLDVSADRKRGFGSCFLARDYFTPQLPESSLYLGEE